MDAALRFLLIAKRAEIRVLERLALSCELVSLCGELIHRLQRERGASSLFLASAGLRFADELATMRGDVDVAADAVRAGFERLPGDAVRSDDEVRLFSRIAFVLHGLNTLPQLRADVSARSPGCDDSTAAYSRLVGSLIAVVFEAADAATDPGISALLVALFNFIQGKELAGQERAAGVAGFSGAGFDAERSQRIADLVEAQTRCFEVFSDFAPPDLLLRWHNACAPDDEVELERMRRAARGGVEPALPADAWQAWFTLQTRRIDAMKGIEDQLTARLAAACSARIAASSDALSDHEAVMKTLAAMSAPLPSPDAMRSVQELLHEQALRIQRMSDELASAKAALEARKLIERGKGVLMAHHGISEERAYRLLRETAMNQGRRVVEVAESVLALGALLQPGGRAPRRNGH